MAPVILLGMARPRLRRRSPATGTAPESTTGRTSPEGPSDPTGTTVTEERPPADEQPDEQPNEQPEESADVVEAGPLPTAGPRPGGRLGRLTGSTPALLVRAAHPRQALLTAVLMAVVAALADRPTRDLGLVLLTVLVGQTVLGWHNDLVDRRTDAAHARTGKPVADGRLDPGTVWFALACALLLLVPLSIAHGVTAGSLYLCSVAIGLLGNLVLRRTVLSFVPWAAAFALYPAFLSFGGWGGEGTGLAPQPAMVVLAALLGIGVHVLTSLWGLVADHEDGWGYLPLRLGMRLGAARLLGLTAAYLGVVTVLIAVTGTAVGLTA